MSTPEINANTCIYRYTRQKILLDDGKSLIPPEGIPVEGLCWVRRDFRGLLMNCEYPFSSENCHRSKNSDFCEELWAKSLGLNKAPPKI